MKDIKIINKINQEEKSLTTLKINDVEFALTEKELEDLYRKLYVNRPDIFNEVVKEYIEEIDGLKRELEDAEECIDNLKDEIRFYEDNGEEE